MTLQEIKGLFTANDMTQGTPWKSIARFAFPMLVGNFAQQLYNTVDAVVVGRSRWGYTALASVGNALPVIRHRRCGSLFLQQYFCAFPWLMALLR